MPMPGGSFFASLTNIWDARNNFFKTDCPFGCPCDAFDCKPDKKSVLALNSLSTNVPVLIKYDG